MFVFESGPCGGLSTSMGTASAAASTVASSVGEDAVEVSDEEEDEADASMMLAAILLKTRLLPREPRTSLLIPATNRNLLLLLLLSL